MKPQPRMYLCFLVIPPAQLIMVASLPMYGDEHGYVLCYSDPDPPDSPVDEHQLPQHLLAPRRRNFPFLPVQSIKNPVIALALC